MKARPIFEDGTAICFLIKHNLSRLSPLHCLPNPRPKNDHQTRNAPHTITLDTAVSKHQAHWPSTTDCTASTPYALSITSAPETHTPAPASSFGELTSGSSLVEALQRRGCCSCFILSWDLLILFFVSLARYLLLVVTIVFCTASTFAGLYFSFVVFIGS